MRQNRDLSCTLTSAVHAQRGSIWGRCAKVRPFTEPRFRDGVSNTHTNYTQPTIRTCRTEQAKSIRNLARLGELALNAVELADSRCNDFSGTVNKLHKMCRATMGSASCPARAVHSPIAAHCASSVVRQGRQIQSQAAAARAFTGQRGI